MVTAPSIIRVLDLSTAHVTPGTMQRIDDGESAATMQSEYGALISTYMPDHPDRDFYPSDLRLVLAYGRHHGCAYVLLDRDGPETDSLPTYEW